MKSPRSSGLKFSKRLKIELETTQTIYEMVNNDNVQEKRIMWTSIVNGTRNTKINLN